MTKKLSANTEASFDELVDRIWNAVIAADVSPDLSHVEIMFGSGGAPWDGVSQRKVTYYLTSQRVDRLVLLSFNECNNLCSNQFPQCFRVEYGSESQVASNKHDPVARANVEPQAKSIRQCGRLFDKNQKGLREALMLARYVHTNSLAKERTQWATLVEYKSNGEYRVIDTWLSIADHWPSDKQIATMLARGRMHVCTSGWVIFAQILAGAAVIALILTLISLISDTTKKRGDRKKKPVANRQTTRPDDTLMGQTLFYDN